MWGEGGGYCVIGPFSLFGLEKNGSRVGALGLGNLGWYFTDSARGLKNRNGALTIACGKRADRGALTIASEHAADIRAGALTIIESCIGPAH